MNKTKLNDALRSATTPEKTAYLLTIGADVNAKDNEGMTALMYAQTPEQTKLLINAGADVNARSYWGNTALTLAKTPEQTKLLLNAMNANSKKTTPIESFIKSITTKLLQKLR